MAQPDGRPRPRLKARFTCCGCGAVRGRFRHGQRCCCVGASAWAPLRVRAFRALWTAQLSSMIGTWMQTVGAQWLLVAEPNAATLVALVQTAAMPPTLLLALRPVRWPTSSTAASC